MANENDKNIQDDNAPDAASACPQDSNAPGNKAPGNNAPDFAKLADAASPEGSSINSEDYWFLKLNGNC
ncbi:MAG: hypothetical protein IJ734_07655 [Fibrobacter sp.]|nr:hypothetical protein [Fibrobacter sp.]